MARKTAGGMKGNMVGNGSSGAGKGYRGGLSGSGLGRVRVSSQRKPYKIRLSGSGRG